MKNTRSLRLPITPPYDVQWMLDFLARRAIAGIESVDGDCYERTLPDGRLRVWLAHDLARVEAPRTLEAGLVRQRVRDLFDLDANAAVIDAHLSKDADMAVRVRARPGLRVPGAWSTYELAIRAILGQQVSVDRATRLAQALVSRYGVAGDFPSPSRLARCNPAELGMPGRRGEAVRRVAEYFTDADADSSAAGLRTGLLAIPGIGPWTAEYVAMRAGRDSNAFPASDWVVLKELDATPAGARRRALAWQPYSAYAVMYLWAAAGRRRDAAKGE